MKPAAPLPAITTRVRYAPAVAEVVAVTGSPATVTLVLTLDEAAQLAGVIGKTCWPCLPGLYAALRHISERNDLPTSPIKLVKA